MQKPKLNLILIPKADVKRKITVAVENTPPVLVPRCNLDGLQIKAAVLPLLSAHERRHRLQRANRAVLRGRRDVQLRVSRLDSAQGKARQGKAAARAARRERRAASDRASTRSE